jgi:hypothetical protein
MDVHNCPNSKLEIEGIKGSGKKPKEAQTDFPIHSFIHALMQ